MTMEENLILKELAWSEGPIGKPFYDSQKNIISYWIIKGVPTKLEAYPLSSSPRKYSDPMTVQEWRTDEEKLDFVRQFGTGMEDPIFQNYSRASRPQRTDVELRLLKRLASGEFDGPLNNYWVKRNGSYGWCEIQHGVPIQFSQTKSTRFFNGTENETIPGKIKTYLQYKTDEEKLDFFRKFGRDMTDEDARKYYWDNWSKRYQK